MGRDSALLNLCFGIGPLLFGVSIAVSLAWVTFAPLQAAVLTALAYLIGFTLFASAKIATIRRGQLFSWGSDGMTSACRYQYRAGYVLMGFALIPTICLLSVTAIH